MAIISGNTSEPGRVIILRDTDWSTEAIQNLPAGDFKVTYLSTGTKSVFFRREDGRVVGYGLVQSYQPDTQGVMFSWGRNQYGELGQNITNEPVSAITAIGEDTDWAMARCGSVFTMAIKNNGTLWSCGSNTYGQLGQNDTTHRSTFTQVGTDTDWVDVKCTSESFIAQKSDGTLWSCGNNTTGQLAQADILPRSTATKIGADTDWAKYSCSTSHTVAIKTNGTIWCWGSNTNGKFGNNTSGDYSTTPIQTSYDDTWQTVSCGGGHILAIKNSGTLWTWGYNSAGELGLGNNTNRSTPIQVGSNTNWTKVSGGILCTTSFAMNSDGELWATGLNVNGQLGVNDNISKSTFTRVGTDTDWDSVSNGFYHTLFLKNNGTLWGSGNNFYGQLTSSFPLNVSTPTQIGSDSDWAMLASGTYRSFVLK